MEEKKYLKNIWNKCLIVGIVLGCSSCMFKYKKLEKQLSEVSNRSSFVAVSINYHDSIYRIIVRDRRGYLEDKYQNTFRNALKKSEVLNVDSTTFTLLKTDIINPQHRIDSVYGGKMDNLLSVFFDERGVISDSLSYEEEKYLIDILFRNNVLTNIDCETGLLVICE